MKAYKAERERRRIRRMIKRRHEDAVLLSGSHELVTLLSGVTRLRSRRTGELFEEVKGLGAWMPVFYSQSTIDKVLWKQNPMAAFFGVSR